MAKFKYALGGKLFRGRIELANATRALEVIEGVGGGLAPGDYSVVGLPLVRVFDTVLIAGATDNENYTMIIKGRPFTVDSGVAATVTTIRDALFALLTAPIQASLGIIAATSGADSITLLTLTAGDALNTQVTADTPANISLTEGMDDNGGATPVGIAAKLSGQIDIRASAAITASFELAVVG